MMMTADLTRTAVTSQPPEGHGPRSWSMLWTTFSARVAPADPKPRSSIGIVGSPNSITSCRGRHGICGRSSNRLCPRASQAIIDFWNGTQRGKAVLILDGLSVRECPWLLEQAEGRGLQGL